MALKLGETPRDRIFLEGPTSLAASSAFPLIHLFCKGGKRPSCLRGVLAGWTGIHCATFDFVRVRTGRVEPGPPPRRQWVGSSRS